MNETIIVDNKQLGEMLGVSEGRIRNYISEGKIDVKLNEFGYELKRRFKDGRKMKCEIELKSKNENTLKGIGKTIFKTNKLSELCDYILYRDENEDLPISKSFLSELCNVSRVTITKWDRMMMENGFMSNDGCFYIVKSLNYDGSVRGYSLTDVNEYNSFIKSTFKYRKAKTMLKMKLFENKISSDEYDMLYESINESLYKATDNKNIYKISKYNMSKNNELYKSIIELIENTLVNKTKSDYRQYWLEENINNDWRRKEYEINKSIKENVNEYLKQYGATPK